MLTVLNILGLILEVFIGILIVYALLSWIPPTSIEPLEKLKHAVAVVADPILRPVRERVAPLEIGNMRLDLSLLVVVVVGWYVVCPLLRG